MKFCKQKIGQNENKKKFIEALFKSFPPPGNHTLSATQLTKYSGSFVGKDYK